MNSDVPKVLHRIAGRSMLAHILATAEALAPERTVIVVGQGMDDVAEAAAPHPTVIQSPQAGTGHAVLQTRTLLDGFAGDILVLYADTPFLSIETLNRMIAARDDSRDPAVVVLGFRPDDPGAYGRLITGGEDDLDAIVEFRDADEVERAIGLCNSGVMAIDGAVLFDLLDRVGNDNAKGEYYLTDIVGLARDTGRPCTVVEADEAELLGVNDRADLARAEAICQDRLRAAAMAGGATLTDPATVWLSADTVIGRDVSIAPNVFFGPGVSIGDRVEIRPNCHIEGATVEEGARIGPFARLRPGAHIGPGARIGNFVEIKAARVEAGAKVNHLTYIGDARIGEGANIGAGTITCNYDGIRKSHTDIGAGAFIGSNSALVAPVKIGDGAIVGAGSVITRDVGAEGLAVTRAPQKESERGAARWRARRKKD